MLTVIGVFFAGLYIGVGLCYAAFATNLILKSEEIKGIKKKFALSIYFITICLLWPWMMASCRQSDGTAFPD